MSLCLALRNRLGKSCWASSPELKQRTLEHMIVAPVPVPMPRTGADAATHKGENCRRSHAARGGRPRAAGAVAHRGPDCRRFMPQDVEESVEVADATAFLHGVD